MDNSHDTLEHVGSLRIQIADCIRRSKSLQKIDLNVILVKRELGYLNGPITLIMTKQEAIHCIQRNSEL